MLPSPRFNFDEFQKKLANIVKDNEIDIVVPIHEETLYLSKIDKSKGGRSSIFGIGLLLRITGLSFFLVDF